MSAWRYTIILTPEPDGSAFNVTVPALPGCFTYGATRDEAVANAREAIAVHIRGLELDGEPVPDDMPASEILSIEP
jgi:antitoxin HicB